MVTAIALLNVDNKRINKIAGQLSEMDGITEVFSVTGEYDLVAMIRASENDKLAEIATEHLLQVDGIQKSETMLSYRCYSKHDLECMFSVGTDEWF